MDRNIAQGQVIKLPKNGYISKFKTQDHHSIVQPESKEAMKTFLFLAAFIVVSQAGLINIFHDEPGNPILDETHNVLAGLETAEELEECLCDEGDMDDGNRTKRQCCGYGYCGCGTATAGGTGTGGTGTGGKKSEVVVIPYPIPAPAVPPPTQQIVVPPSPQLPALPQTSILTGNTNGESACDRLRLILTLTNQLEGLKLVEIAGQCVVQIEKQQS